MPLIVCEECNKQISDTVSKCPHCGFKIVKKTSLITMAVVVLVATVIVGSCISANGSKPVDNSASYTNSPIPLDAGVHLDDVFVNNNYAVLVAAVDTIHTHGNACDSIRTARTSVYDGTMVISCNDLKYEYEIKDVGGKLAFKVIR
jgi:hypothetical protein